jgi:hypothetical protein
VEVGDQDPQQADQGQGEERVVDPQPAAGVTTHANIRSHEHLFCRKNFAWHKGVTVLSLSLCALVLLAGGCLVDPQRTQSVQLLDRLSVFFRAQFASAAPGALETSCDTVGDVQTRLYGEPGLSDVQPAWGELRDAAEALHALCGQAVMLAQPVTGSAAMDAARQRWQDGEQRELGVACEHLRAAAVALARPSPC